MSPSGPRSVCSEADRVILILTSSHAHRISIEGRPTGHLSRSPERLGHLPRGGLRSSRMPHEGYDDLIKNDGPGFHSDMPISELSECDTRGIEAIVVSSAPPVAKTMNGVTHKNSNQPLPSPTGLRGSGRPTPRHDLGCA